MDIRRRALVAFALNRTPGFHFPGNFLGVMFTNKTHERVELELCPGPFCEELDGQVNHGAIALLADIALASVVRANLTPAQRLATVSMQLQFTGVRRVGPLNAAGAFAGFLNGAAGQQGLSRVTMAAAGREVLFGSGTFMVLDPPPGVTMYPPVSADHSAVDPLPESALTETERQILRRIDTTLARPGQRSFVQRFWGQDPRPTAKGALCVVENDLHLGNRVGYMQGGLQVGLAIDTANAAVPKEWMISGISACFISPGAGAELRAESEVVHRGRHTAVVRTLISNAERRVLDTTSTHAYATEF